MSMRRFGASEPRPLLQPPGSCDTSLAGALLSLIGHGPCGRGEGNPGTPAFQLDLEKEGKFLSGACKAPCVPDQPRSLASSSSTLLSLIFLHPPPLYSALAICLLLVPTLPPELVLTSAQLPLGTLFSWCLPWLLCSSRFNANVTAAERPILTGP